MYMLKVFKYSIINIARNILISIFGFRRLKNENTVNWPWTKKFLQVYREGSDGGGNRVGGGGAM